MTTLLSGHIYLERSDQINLLIEVRDNIKKELVRLDKICWDEDLESFATELLHEMDVALHNSDSSKYEERREDYHYALMSK